MEWIIRDIASTNWITITIVICMTILVVIKHYNAVGFSDFMTLFSSDKYMVTYQKNAKLLTVFNVLLGVIQSVSISLFIYICFDIYTYDTTATGVLLFIQITIVYMVMMCSKMLIDKIVASVFAIENVVGDYLFYKLTYRSFFSIILLPISVVCIYVIKPSPIALNILLVMIAILNLTVLFSVFKKNEKFILSNLFYFILYLCALEVAPYIILYNLIL